MLLLGGTMEGILQTIHGFVWGAPALVLILGVGLLLSIRLRFAQIRLLPRAMGQLWAQLRPGGHGEEGSSFQALCTALAATVGTGNLVGVAGAISLGGPGAVFWMWVCGLLGMATKYAEATLAVRYREQTPSGWVGGPMYVITRGLGKKAAPLALCYSLFGMLAAFGVGNATQISAMMEGFDRVFQGFGWETTNLSHFLLGLALAVLVGTMLLGGGKRIGAVAEGLVPFLAAGYMLLCAGVLIGRFRYLPNAFGAILRGAFCPRAVTGGLLGSAFAALRIGCSRGVFTNEAGMGTASIAHAAARVEHPAQQGLMGIIEVFLDTIVICTLTALVILVSGVDIPYGTDGGTALTNAAFGVVYGPAAEVFLAAAICCFAFATVLGWGLYGGRCAEYLFGSRAWKWFALAQTVVVVLGACLKAETVWLAAEILNGLMAIPNLLALGLLAPEVARLTREYAP